MAQSSKICAHAVPLPVQRFRALVVAPFLSSFESCTCAVQRTIRPKINSNDFRGFGNELADSNSILVVAEIF